MVTEDRDPDEVMLNPGYLKSEQETDPLDCALRRPLTAEEMEAFGKARRRHGFGIDWHPVFFLREIGRKDRRPVRVPIVGIHVRF